MKKLHLIFNHKLSKEQEEDARIKYGINEVVYLPEALQKVWVQVPSELATLQVYLSPLKEYILGLSKNDYALVQGDFGATYILVNYVKEQGLKAIYATTKRDVVEKKEGDKNIKISVFTHVQYREYGE